MKGEASSIWWHWSGQTEAINRDSERFQREGIYQSTQLLMEDDENTSQIGAEFWGACALLRNRERNKGISTR